MREATVGTMTVHQSISDAWKDAVVSQKIVNEFEAPADDPQGRWKKGDRVTFGLRLTVDELDYFAENRTNSCPIQVVVEEKPIGESGFVCQFNGYRALRPGGAPAQLGRQKDIPSDVADCRFYCQNPKKGLSLLKRDPLAQVKVHHWWWNAYYNASPFEKEGHFLWVPVVVDGTNTVLPHFPQFLTRAFLHDTLLLFRRSQQAIVFFNSLHAGASVNHIHIQAVFHRGKLAIESAPSVEYKGYTILEGYPAQGFAFPRDVDSDRIFQSVDRLQQAKIPFNLVCLGDRVFVLPRNPEHEIVQEFPGGVLATMEFSGKIITPDRGAYDRIDENTIRVAFEKASTPVRELIDRW